MGAENHRIPAIGPDGSLHVTDGHLTDAMLASHETAANTGATEATLSLDALRGAARELAELERQTRERDSYALRHQMHVGDHPYGQ